MSDFNWNENFCDDVDEYGYGVINHEVTVTGDLVVYVARAETGWSEGDEIPKGPTDFDEVRDMLKERRDYYKERYEDSEQILWEAMQATQFRNKTEWLDEDDEEDAEPAETRDLDTMLNDLEEED
jgi:hypothetical protein